jgi:hypothetical protein
MAGPIPPRDVLQQLGAGANFEAYKVAISTPENPVDQAHRHRMERMAAIFGMVLVLVILCFGIYLAGWHADADVRKGGIGLLLAILGGAMGFLAGRATR